MQESRLKFSYGSKHSMFDDLEHSLSLWVNTNTSQPIRIGTGHRINDGGPIPSLGNAKIISFQPGTALPVGSFIPEQDPGISCKSSPRKKKPFVGSGSHKARQWTKVKDHIDQLRAVEL
jgi:hypothetical protein